MKKIISLILVLVAVLSLFAGCGKKAYEGETIRLPSASAV